MKIGDKVIDGHANRHGWTAPATATASDGASDCSHVCRQEAPPAARAAAAPASPATRGASHRRPAPITSPAPADFGGVHASPAVRRLARELDIDLTKINGTGEKGRITKEDVKRPHAAAAGAAPPAMRAGMGIPAIPSPGFLQVRTDRDESRCRA